MLSHYLSVAFRGLRSGRAATLINLFGLAVGLSAALVLGQLIRAEFGYDVHHPQADRLMRLQVTDAGAGSPSALIAPAIGPTVLDAIPDIEVVGRLTPVGPLLSLNDTHIVPDAAFWADPSVLNLFGFEWLYGAPDLSDASRIVLSERTAARLFGERNPVGKTILLNEDDPLTVTGVFRDMPAKTHLHIDALVSLTILDRWFDRPVDSIWDSPNYATYVRVAPGVDLDRVNDAFSGFLAEHATGETATARLDAILVSDIHLSSTAIGELEPGGNRVSVGILGAIGLLILFIAGANFVNLATARMDRRLREVRLRKSIGASTGQLLLQFWLEAVVLAVVASLVASIAAYGMLPWASSVAGRTWETVSVGPLELSGLALVFGIVLGSLSGLFPAVVLARIRPLPQRTSGLLRRPGNRVQQALVVVQFALAVIILTATFTVMRQLQFVQALDPGFASSGVVTMPGIRDIADDFGPFRNRLLANPAIEEVSHAWRPPGEPLLFSTRAASETAEATVYPFFADARYASTMGLSFVGGHSYREDVASEMASGVYVNETAARALGYATPAEAVGHDVMISDRPVSILGVVRDFHQESLHAPVAPMVFLPEPSNYRSVLVRFTTNDVQALAQFLEAAWEPFEGHYPVEPRFLDTDLASLYQEEERLAGTFSAFAALGILVACLGLLGMAGAATQRRRREIGVRKALGATTGSVSLLMLRHQLSLTIVGLALGIPVAVILANAWLGTFAYHVDLAWHLPVLAGAVSTVAAALAVAVEAIRAGRLHPVDALRVD